MPKESLPYRARKWLVQQISERFKRPDQHQRLLDLDYDAMVVLDACRWDVLDDVTEWPFDRARSPGSQTPQWLDVAEDTGIFEGAHVVSGQGQYEHFDDLGEAEVYPIWEDHYDHRLQTVPPREVLEPAEDVLYSGKTPTVVHLVPPHAPYIARVGEEWLLTEPSVNIWKRPQDDDGDSGFLPPQVAMAEGYVDIPRARKGYRASVESTWEVAAEYVGRWAGDGHTVVVTADHGEVFGRWREFGLYEHPARCHIRPLVEVPFEVFEPGEDPHEPAETTEEKLAALGYVEGGGL